MSTPNQNGSNNSCVSDQLLRITPNRDHKSENYDDVESDYDPAIFAALEKHLPPNMLGKSRDVKAEFMKGVLARYFPNGERSKVQKHKDYRKNIMSSYQPLHKELYNFNATDFLEPSFVNAIKKNTEESFRSIMDEPSSGVYIFQMFQPKFCKLFLAEVEHFDNWTSAAKFKTMKPNTMNKYGAVLDDFGFEPMLNKLMEEFICPLARVFYTEVGGSTLDSHHGFVVEYGVDKDLELGFHVDDSEVTLNVCLGTDFTGGELYFRGVRCDKHVNTEALPEEYLEYTHVPGQAVLHRGRHRHGARPTTAGERINLLMWCRRLWSRQFLWSTLTTSSIISKLERIFICLPAFSLLNLQRDEKDKKGLLCMVQRVCSRKGRETQAVYCSYKHAGFC